MMTVYDDIKLRYLMRNIRKQGLRIREIRRWEKAFSNFLWRGIKKGNDYKNRWKIIEGFAKSNIKVIKREPGLSYSKEPVVICVVRDERERMEIFLKHYRKLGIRKFAILDNNSTDGTVEYLKEQRGVDLYQTKDKFLPYIKEGWINRLISCYGTAGWYIIADADELLSWVGMEERGIQEVIKYLEKKKITRARALMVDMYPKGVEWNRDRTFEEAFLECKYFDGDTYCYEEAQDLYLLCGGPRKRKLGMEPWLTKYPLFRLGEMEILSDAHMIFPYDNRKTPCFFALRHYKFLTGKDWAKVKQYVKEGNHIAGSAEYKIYERKNMENKENFNFYYEGSIEYRSSNSLSQIHEIKKM